MDLGVAECLPKGVEVDLSASVILRDAFAAEIQDSACACGEEFTGAFSWWTAVEASSQAAVPSDNA